LTTLTITTEQVVALLPEVHRKNVAAVRRAIKRTVEVDAHRWIDWSIRGGGWEGGEYFMPIDRGEYAASWVGHETEEGGTFYSSATPAVKAGVIEYGRKAAWIPLEPLTDWVVRKLGFDEEEARSVAYAISRHASEHDRPGLFVLERAHPKIAEALQANVVRELKEAIG
jgi:hypothetical protein